MNALQRTLCIAALATSGLLQAGTASAQQKFPYTQSVAPQASKYVQDHSIEVDDIPGHKVRVVEIARSFTKDHPVIAGVKVVEMVFRGATDYVNGNGPGFGYETWTMENGDKVFLEGKFMSFTEATPKGFRKGTSHASNVFLGGTGKFAGIRGTILSNTEFNTDPQEGYNRPIYKGEYWFDK
jgi:hypothetical protein